MPSMHWTDEPLSPGASTLVHSEPEHREHVYILRIIRARTAVWLCSFLILLISAFLGVGGNYLVKKLDHVITDYQRLVIFFHIMSFTFLGVSGIAGICAAITNTHTTRPQLFAALLCGHLIFGVISGAMCLHIIFQNTTSLERVASCSRLIATAAWNNLCHNGMLVKALSLGTFEFAWMLEVLSIYVAIKYASQLRAENNLKTVTYPVY
ncbi:hypothetical protein JR316_0011662 [Psilocybe cubensis]|uniref:Uncharacterized protein n=2 Tax=Psilocybe cubensis TaxID=181762 RepID=A0A8H7XXM3_PSICU|nr:hypothetical protein JR316_0011662 [Psilocybe cubensis]KAH9476092.1 hypothetical protein JR316_0011662 [Psilocybe cubensis]